MGISKIEKRDGEVLIDLTADTVTPDTLLEGITAHNAQGEAIVGTHVDGTAYEGKYCWQAFKSDSDITPVMTANTTGEYTAFASSEVSTPRQAWCAFDNISGTDQEANRWHGAADDLPGYIGLIFPEPVAVESFTVKNASAPHYGINGFSIQGSNDGSTWKSMGSYSNPSGYGVESSYTVESPAPFTRWRLYITSTHHTSSGKSYCIIDEIKFYTTKPEGFVVSDDANAYPSAGTDESGRYYVAIGAL